MSEMASQITSVSIFLLNRFFGCRSKKTSKLRVTGLCAGNSLVTGEFLAHKKPVTRKMFPFDDVIMKNVSLSLYLLKNIFTHKAIACSCYLSIFTFFLKIEWYYKAATVLDASPMNYQTTLQTWLHIMLYWPFEIQHCCPRFTHDL